jgi:polysaccharide biosynthesis/export protein
MMWALCKTWSKRGLGTVTLLLCGIYTTAQAPQQNPSGASSQSETGETTPQLFTRATNAEAVIGSGDLLEVKIFGVPDYSQQVRVSDDGMITLPLVGAVKVGDMPVSDAERLISQRLDDGGYFRNPQVSILQKEFAAQGISVLGEVQKPGIYVLQGHRTLFDALSSAGGTTQKAGRVVTITHRAKPNQPITVNLSYDSTNSPSSNVPVTPGDTVVISKAGIVYVVGDVGLPSGIVMENPQLTVLQAIAMAQGTKSTAALDKAKIIRKSGDGQQEIPLSLKKILAAQAPDLRLEANDIVFVPNSLAKTIGSRGLEAAVQMATGVVVYSRF